MKQFKKKVKKGIDETIRQNQIINNNLKSPVWNNAIIIFKA